MTIIETTDITTGMGAPSITMRTVSVLVNRPDHHLGCARCIGETITTIKDSG